MCRVGKVTRGQATEDKHVGENGRDKKQTWETKNLTGPLPPVDASRQAPWPASYSPCAASSNSSPLLMLPPR